MMASSRSKSKRSAGEWLVRSFIALTCLMLGALSVQASIGKAIVRSDPRTAHLLAPSDGSITAALADRLLTTSLAFEASSEPARLARLALRQDPTAVKAVGVVALQASLRNEPATSDRAHAYSLALSRREVRAQLWAIQQAVAIGDVSGALSHYDTALRSSFSAQELLYPVLAGAIKERRVREEVVQLLRRNPTWAPTFATYLAVSGVAPEAAVALQQAAGPKLLPLADSHRATLLDTLLRDGNADLAWQFDVADRGAVRRDVVRSPTFQSVPQTPGPFDWRIPESRGVSASILSSGEGNVVEFAVSAGGSDPILAQTLLLPPATYRLNSFGDSFENAGARSLTWVIACQDGREIGRIVMAAQADGSRRARGTFNVPNGCGVQNLVLEGRADGSFNDLRGQIRSVTLQRQKDM